MASKRGRPRENDSELPGDPLPAEDPAPEFEGALGALEGIVAELESGKLSLTESIAQYERGVAMLRHCHQALQQAEQKIELLAKVQSDGSYESTPFETSAARSGAGNSSRSPARRERTTTAPDPGSPSPREAGLFEGDVE